MTSPSFDSRADLFDDLVEKLVQSLRALYLTTGREGDFTVLAHDIRTRFKDIDVAAALTDRYLEDLVDSDKLGHLVETSLAFAIKSAVMRDDGSPDAWAYLCRAHFVGGMAATQMSISRGAQRRAQPYEELKEAIMRIIASSCPPEKWISLEEMWRSIEEAVVTFNEQHNGKPWYSKNPKAAFDRLAKSRRADLLPFLSSPVRRGRRRNPTAHG